MSLPTRPNLKNYEANPYDGDAQNPWEDIGDDSGNPEEILFAESKPENKKALLFVERLMKN